MLESRVTPVAARRYALSVMMSGGMRERLQRYGELVSHIVPDGDLARILDNALEIAIRQREKRKFGATDKPRTTLALPGPHQLEVERIAARG